MDDDPLLGAPATAPHWYAKKIGPLPVWGYLVIGTAIAGFYWYRSRQSASSAASAAASPALDPTATTAGAQGYSEGYGAGYNTGYAGGLGTGGGVTAPTPTQPPSNPPPGTKYCRDLKDPAGNVRHVCGFGHWFQPKGQTHWYWTPGPIPKNPLRKGIEKAAPYNPPNSTATRTANA